MGHRILYIPRQSTTPINLEFITEWNLPSGNFTFPTANEGTFDAVIDWGDGTATSVITAYNDANLIHNYTSSGTYQIIITGSFPRMWVNNNADVKTKLTKVIQWGDVGFLSFAGAFYGCVNLISLPDSSITGATGVTVNAFYRTFYGCTGLTSIPTDLFRYCTLVSTSGFLETFLGCTSLTSIPTDLFRYNTLVSTSGFYGTFSTCTSLTSIPTDLFRYNTLVSTSGFAYTFRNNTGLTSIPADLFRYNTLVSTSGFTYTFYGCSNLAAVPANLFRYNTLVSTSGFAYTFTGCVKLQLNRNIFYADGEQSTRFLNQSISFNACFLRNSFTGIQGEAPDLWNCDFGTGTPITTRCYANSGNSLTSLSNYADIPAGWK